jgi:hypothetical protein
MFHALPLQQWAVWTGLVVGAIYLIWEFMG